MRKVMVVLGIAAVVGCGGVNKEKYSAKEAEAAKYQQESASLEAKVKQLEQQNAQLKSQASTAQSQAEATATKLNEQSAEYSKEKNRTIRINEQLLFKENSSALTAEDKRSLDTIADAVKQMPDKAILVAGYTDNTEGGKGGTTKRWQLSSARALEVAKYLASRGIEPARIGVAGFGEAKPVAENDTLANKAQNRRVEIALMPQNLELGTVDVRPAEIKPAK